MKPNVIATTAPDKIENFISLVSAGVESWKKAGAILVELVENNPNVYAEIIKKSSGISLDTLMVFERIGRNEILPELMMSNSLASKKLLSMPIEVQRACIQSGVEVVEVASDGGHSVKRKPLSDLTRSDLDLAFTDKAIRKVDEQYKIIRTSKRAKNSVTSAPSSVWVSLGHFCIVEKMGAFGIEKTQPGKNHDPKKYLFFKDGDFSSLSFEVMIPKNGGFAHEATETTENHEQQLAKSHEPPKSIVCSASKLIENQVADLQQLLLEKKIALQTSHENSPAARILKRDISNLQARLKQLQLLK